MEQAFTTSRRAASQIKKILEGLKPGDIPIEQASKFEFVVNLRTAKAVGLNLPPTLLARANEVIDKRADARSFAASAHGSFGTTRIS